MYDRGMTPNQIEVTCAAQIAILDRHWQEQKRRREELPSYWHEAKHNKSLSPTVKPLNVTSGA